MELEVKTLDGGSAGSVTVCDDVFGIEEIRTDILHRVVRWQLAKRQAGTHKTKGRHEITGTGAKMVRQKGSGGARHGNKKAPLFRGGGRAHGPQPRSHAHELPKKIRALGLKQALSAKANSGSLIVLDTAAVSEPKTKVLKAKFAHLGWENVLFIDGAELDKNFALAARSIPNVDVLPAQGANVYDILRRQTLVVTKAGVEALEARFK